MRSHRLLLLTLALSAPGARAEPAVLAVQVLGSGGPRPSAQASSGTLVLVAGVARLLVDAGPARCFAPAGKAWTPPGWTRCS